MVNKIQSNYENIIWVVTVLFQFYTPIFNIDFGLTQHIERETMKGKNRLILRNKIFKYL